MGRGGGEWEGGDVGREGEIEWEGGECGERGRDRVEGRRMWGEGERCGRGRGGERGR